MESGLALYLKILWRFRGCGLPSFRLISFFALVFFICHSLKFDSFYKDIRVQEISMAYLHE
jgi:hypothetical protein